MEETICEHVSHGEQKCEFISFIAGYTSMRMYSQGMLADYVNRHFNMDAAVKQCIFSRFTAIHIPYVHVCCIHQSSTQYIYHGFTLNHLYTAVQTVPQGDQAPCLIPSKTTMVRQC